MAGVSRRVLVVAAALVASLVLAPSALATEHHPTGIFVPFADCPLSNSEVQVCTFSETTSGEVTIGKRTVPISKTIVLQGGYKENPETGVLTFYGAEDGNTLAKVAQPVPGGILNVVAPEILPTFLQEALNKLISEGITGVTATTELAKPASNIKLNRLNLIFETGSPGRCKPPMSVNCDKSVPAAATATSASNPTRSILNLTTGATSPPAFPEQSDP